MHDYYWPFDHRIHLDYETASEENLKTAGGYRYAAHWTTRPLMLGWAIDDGPVELWQPHVDPMPADVSDALRDPRVCKHAFNAAFERLITRYCLGVDIPYDQWRCTMVEAYYLGFTGGLDGVLKALGMETKCPEGKRLINRFCSPAPKNHRVTWYDWNNSPDEWGLFCEYCRQDVKVERDLFHYLRKFPSMPEWDWKQWFLDQSINDRGVPMDEDMASAAVEMWSEEKRAITETMSELTGLAKVTRGPFIKWMDDNFGVELESTRKDYLASLLKSGELPEEAREYVDMWAQKEGKATSKYTAVANATGLDGRARGMFQYKGAARTDRSGGRIIQLQNLKKPFVKPNPCDETIGALVDSIKGQTVDIYRMCYGMSTSEILGGAIRHVVRAEEGKTFAISDLTSIESVALGWVAQCPTIDRLFRDGRDSYKTFAVEYYGVQYDEVTKAQRTFCKPPVLGCFAGNTKVLTDRGWVPIVHVAATDKVFDGIEFVAHDGVADQGVKPTIEKYGVRATPDHEFCTGENEWTRFDELTDEGATNAVSMVSGVCSAPSRSSTTSNGAEVRTYDVVNAGRRHRFTILTDRGPMVVHNCGYMLGWKGLIAYAEGYGVDMSEEEARRAVDTFRSMYPEIVRFWDWVYTAVKSVTTTGVAVEGYRLHIERDQDFLRIWLPSGRALSYYKPEVRKRIAPWADKVMTDKAEGVTYREFRSRGWDAAQLVSYGYMESVQFIDNFSFMGMNDKNQWVRLFAHAGLITENIVQSVSGDILWHGITKADHRGLPVVLHVHDEIAAEVPTPVAPQSLEVLRECMTTVPDWAPGLWLGADGFIVNRYTKD